MTVSEKVLQVIAEFVHTEMIAVHMCQERWI